MLEYLGSFHMVFAITFGLKNTIFQNQMQTLKENWSRNMNEIRALWIQMKLKSSSHFIAY